MVSHVPLKKPYRPYATIEYSEQDGLNRHEGASSGDKKR